MSNRPISKQSELVLFARVARESSVRPQNMQGFRRDVDTWLAAKRATKHSKQRR